MENKKKISNLDTCFCDYENIQVRHLDKLKTDSLPDLSQMTRERSDVFVILKNTLEDVMATAGPDKISILTRYEIRLSAIMKLDREIEIEIKKHKDTLKSSLSHMKKGKVAMNGYRNAGASVKKPCVLSMNR